MISERILEVVSALGISHMPTRSQIRTYFGNDQLTNKVGKTLGYYGWAEKLNLPIQSNETTTGKCGEAYVCAVLESKGYTVEQMKQNYPYDLFVNKCLKVDVKYSNLYHGKSGNFYSYRLAKKYPTCDFYILVANDDINSKKIYVLPSKDAMQLQISIGEHCSIYEKYVDRYDLIDNYLSLIERIA